MTAVEIVKALSGSGNSAPCPVPGHGKGRGDRRHSLSVHDGIDGKILAKCHGGCPQADVWAVLKAKGLVRNRATSCRRNSRRQEGSNAVTDQPKPSDRRAAALAIWEASVPALHTPAQAYLQCRGIVIQPPACIRYHPSINALVALVQAPDGSFSGVQRIYVATDSRGTWKRPIDKPKKSKGVIKGGAVRLTPTAESLQLCESVEDGLALLQMTGRPTWAVPGASFIPTFEPPTSVSEVILGPDHDEAGLEAIERALKAATNRSLKFRRLLPPPGRDWCDVLEDYDERMAIQEEPELASSWVERFCYGV